MKKTIAILSVLFASTTQSHAAFDLGVLAGISSSATVTSPAFTYGLTGSYDFGLIAIGAKITNFSLSNTSQFNILGQIKKYFAGFFVGLNIGPGLISSSSLSNLSTLVVGPTAGMYFGALLKFGIEVDYNFNTAGGGTIVPMAGVKLAL